MGDRGYQSHMEAMIKGDVLALYRLSLSPNMLSVLWQIC